MLVHSLTFCQIIITSFFKSYDFKLILKFSFIYYYCYYWGLMTQKCTSISKNTTLQNIQCHKLLLIYFCIKVNLFVKKILMSAPFFFLVNDVDNHVMLFDN